MENFLLFINMNHSLFFKKITIFHIEKNITCHFFLTKNFEIKLGAKFFD